MNHVENGHLLAFASLRRSAASGFSILINGDRLHCSECTFPIWQNYNEIFCHFCLVISVENVN